MAEEQQQPAEKCVCLSCGNMIEFPKGVALNSIEMEWNNIKSVIEGNMYLCPHCFEKVHQSLEFQPAVSLSKS